MKRSIIFTICLIMTVILLSTAAFAKPRRGGQAAPDPDAVYDFETCGSVITPGVFDFDTEFTVMPEGYNQYPTEHKGTIERMYYETDVYEDGVTYTKYCTVYLPWGYDPEDRETRYNVLYYQHGNSNSPNDLWDRATQVFNPKQMIDNLFDPDHQILKPFIIICPSYYFEAKKTTRFISDASGPAGDGRYEGIPGNYYKEITEDLIPQIESQFNVYCEDFSEEGIKASRDHRAFGGFSRGSCCTWDILHYDLEYFKYFIPMSASIIPQTGTLNDTLGKATAEEAYTYISETITAHPDLDFFIFATAGGEGDGAGQGMIPQMQEFYKHTDVFSYGTDPEVNNFYFTLSDFDHTDMAVPYTLYNTKEVLFQ